MFMDSTFFNNTAGPMTLIQSQRQKLLGGPPSPLAKAYTSQLRAGHPPYLRSPSLSSVETEATCLIYLFSTFSG